MSDLKIQARMMEQGTVRVSVDGALDAHSYEALEGALNDLFDEGFYRLILDLTRLRSLTSAGAGALIGALATAQQNGGGIRLAEPQPQVIHILDLLGLDRLFQIEAGSGARVRQGSTV
jgi:anti-sigma B factor antagonist